MFTHRTRKLFQSAIVAITIGLIFPALWVGLLGESSKSPIIDKEQFVSMSQQERNKWIESNTQERTFIEHIAYLPKVSTKVVLDQVRSKRTL